jgi:uncharacterized membrane protein YhdT
MSDYVPGRYSGFKNFIYWMATKRRNWAVGAFVLVYLVVTVIAATLAVVNDGAESGLPWIIGLGAIALLTVATVVVLGFSLYWQCPLLPEPDSATGPEGSGAQR